MKNNGGKSNYLKTKSQQIKVNRKSSNNNSQSINQTILTQGCFQQKQNKLIQEENKNIKIQGYFDNGNFVNKNSYTEYNPSPIYPIHSFNSHKANKLLTANNPKSIYSNTNGNINLNKEKNLNLKNKNKLNININNNKKLFKNYTNRELSKTSKITSYKGNKKPNENNKNSFQQQYSYGKKNETQYPLNLPSQTIKIKYQSFNNKNNTIRDNNNINNNEIFNINLDSQKLPNKNEKLKKYHIISPPCTNHNSNNKKTVRQNKSNLNYKRKNNTIISPENINSNYLPIMKNNKSNNYFKNVNHNMTTYNSCYNFYQKTNNNNLPKKNNINMLNTINNFGYLNMNINNSIEGNRNKINSLFEQMNNNEDIYKNNNGFINIIEHDFGRKTNKNKNSILNNKVQNYVDFNNNNLRHKKGKLSENNLNLYHSRINQILNINNTQLINYRKEIIEDFCHYLEEFIFMNVKNNFDFFMMKLKDYCKDKHFNSLLLKRLQNKNIQKNFYKEKAASYKYLEPNITDPHYSSIIMMNNSNIINFQRKADYIPNDFPKEFYGQKTEYNFGNTRSPPLSEKMDRIQKNYRFGKSQEPIDVNNIDTYNHYNNNTYFHNNNLLEDYKNFNKYMDNYINKNNYNERNNLNNDDEEERKSVTKYDTNYNETNNNNLYIPKKLKKINNNKILSKSNERQKKVNNDSDISNPYLNKIKAKKIFEQNLSPQNEINRSHDLNNDIIRAKIKRNYNMNYLRKDNSINNSIYQDISCDMKLNYKNKNENETMLNKTNDIIIKRNNTELNPRNTYDYKTNDILPIYKKKIKITQAKSKIFMNKAAPNNIRNKMIKLNCINKTAEQLLSPNFEKNNKNINFNVKENLDKIAMNHLNNVANVNVNNLRSAYTEPRREINNNLNNIEKSKKGNKIQELTVNLSTNDKNLSNNNNNINHLNVINNNHNNNENENIISKKNEKNVNNKDTILINEAEALNEAVNEKEITNKEKVTNKDNNENNNRENNNTNNNENNTNENENNNTETITVTNNNDNNDYIASSNENNIINDDTDESDDNITKEIIVKDVSTRDKRLNVFIKYVELSEFNTLNNEFNNLHLINSFQTDSIYVPSLYQKHNRNYFDKYYYGNKNDKNNKIKLHQILSSIIEEEEKSKAAGSINNSYLSEEDTSKNGNNYTHFYIQSIKYVSNYLQSIFDDKKKDMYFQFLKILKKIKNESFLRGLINQKKFQTLNKSKNEEEKDNKTEDNNSEDIMQFNDNENNNDTNVKNSENKDSESKSENNESVKNDEDISINKSMDCMDVENRKYFSTNKEQSKNKSFYNLENIELKTYKSVSYFDINKDKMNIVIHYNKLKQIVENLDEYKNWKLIEKSFKFWKKEKNEKEEISFSDKRTYSDIQLEYEKNVTMSEACRGLSDVILDFKLFLIKYSLRNTKEKE